MLFRSCVIPFPPGSRICAAPGGFFYTASFRAGSESQISGLKTSFNNSWSQTSPKFGVNFQLNSATLLYASWSKGFKSGGFQGRATPGNTTPAFDPETVKTTEVGFKSEFADHKVRLNAAAFFTKYTGAQILISQIVNGTPQFVTANAGDSDIKGIELELVARPAPGFDVNASLGWIDNHYTRLNPGAAAFNIGLEDSLPNTPKYTFALGTQYRWAVGTGGSILVRGDYSWRDDQSFQAANNPNDIQKAYGLLDLRATWLSANSTLSVSAFLRNALNEGYFTSLSDQRFGGSLGVSLATLGLPREYGVEFGYRF